MAHIKWTAPAVDDLTDHRRFIARISEESAIRAIERILTAIDQLEAFPLSGGILPATDRDDVRRLIVDRFTVIYQLRADGAWIMMVHRSARTLRRDELLARLATDVERIDRSSEAEP